MKDIEEFLSIAREGHDECGKVLMVGKRHLNAVKEKISELRKLEADLSKMLDDCRASGDCSCPVLDNLLRDPLTKQ